MSYFDPGSVELIVLNCLSILGSVLTLSFLLWLKLAKPVYFDRVSLKAQIFIATIDIIRHLNLIFNYNSNENLCAFSGYVYIFGYHAATYLNFTLALNIQIIYLHEKSPMRGFGHLLYIILIFISLVLDLIPFAINVYGKASSTSCFINKDYEYREIAKTVLLYITLYPFLIYCFIIPVIVMLKLLIKQPSPADRMRRYIPYSRFFDPLSRKLVFRVSLYPLSCSLCHLGSMVYSLMLTFGIKPNPNIHKWTLIGLGSCGIVNFIIFLMDPFIQEAVFPPTPDQPRNPEERRPLTQEPEAQSSEAQASTPAAIVQPQSVVKDTISSEKPEETVEPSNVASSSTSSPPRGRCYVQPIPIPGARDPNEVIKLHTSDLHLDWRHLYKYD